MAAKHCIFCGACDTTLEHVIPRWINDAFPDADANMWTQGSHGSEHTWQSIGPGRTVKAPCANCNSGWMSALESTCMGELTQMMNGQDCLLSQTSQRSIALWATKTCMMADLLASKDERVFRSEDFLRLYQQRVPSRRSRIGRIVCNGPVLDLLSRHSNVKHLIPQKQDQDPPAREYLRLSGGGDACERVR